MKVLLLIAATLLLTLTVTAQTRFSLFAGPQVTSANYKIFGKKQETEIKIGFQAGLGLKVPFENRLFFTPAAFYSMKGYKVTYNAVSALPDSNAVDNNTTIHTFELAALLQYDFSNAPGHFFIKGGPSIDIQLFGKERFNLTNATSVSRNMKFSYGDYGYVSANLIGQLGYETSGGFIIFAHYSLGVGNIVNMDIGPRIRHRAFGLSLGKYIR